MSPGRGQKVELLTMSKKELTRFEVMQRLKAKRLSQAEASGMLGISVRQVKRLYAAYRKAGAKGLVSQKRGKASNHRLDKEVVQTARDLIYARYADFGPTLAHEKLAEKHGLKISDESVRQLMIAEGLWKPKRSKAVATHQMRERRACVGELVQIDGSDHEWFEKRGPRCTLLVFIDDASGQLMELWFVGHESFFGYGEAARHYFQRHGRPLAFYSDKHGVFRVNQSQDQATGAGITQFGRAMQTLDIQIVCANTPQAKGRVERANQTLQDRLVKELRLAGISDPVAGNAYLETFRQDFNQRFAVTPRSAHNAHRPLLATDDLDLILSHQETRTLTKNLTLQYEQQFYQIQTDRPSYTLNKAVVTLCQSANGVVRILYQGKELAYTRFQKQERQSVEVSSKTIDHELDHPEKAHKPAANHPWRKSYPHNLTKNVEASA
jgi:transposase